VGQQLVFDHMFGTADSKRRTGCGEITRSDNDHGLEQHAGLLCKRHSAEKIFDAISTTELRVSIVLVSFSRAICSHEHSARRVVPRSIAPRRTRVPPRRYS
jgi:hypothetical protein